MQLFIHCEETIEPKCRHFKVCGGCSFQHIPYDEQLSHKQAFVSQCFRREVERILPCEPAWRYRNKMEFSFSQSKSGEKFLGLMRRKGRVENLEECHLTHTWFAETLNGVRRWWQESDVKAYYPPSNQGLLRTLILREGVHTGEKMAVLTVSEESFDQCELEGLKESIPKDCSIILRKQIVQKKTPTTFTEQVVRGCGYIHEILHDAEGVSYRFRIRAASFFQPNTCQAEMIYQKVIECADFKGKEQILDLYCGTGSLGIFASKYVSEVIGIELVAEAVEDAYINLKINGISNMKLIEGDVGQKLNQISCQPQIVIIDPPRTGLGERAIKHLIQLQPEKIIYVSCNPVTQAADCAMLDYEIVYVQPIDQFPHTRHIETIALLKRKFR